jgi:hypothetical protein
MHLSFGRPIRKYVSLSVSENRMEAILSSDSIMKQDSFNCSKDPD